MKFLHISDLHIGKRVNEFSMIEDQKYILRQIKEIALEKQVDAVMIAGDIYDKPVPSAEAVQLFDQFLTGLADCGKKVFAVSGNHDSAERIAFGAQLMSSREVYVSPVYDGEVRCVTCQDAYGELCIWLLPFIRPAVVRHAWRKVTEGISIEKKMPGQNRIWHRKMMWRQWKHIRMPCSLSYPICRWTHQSGIYWWHISL